MTPPHPVHFFNGATIVAGQTVGPTATPEHGQAPEAAQTATKSASHLANS